MFEPSYRGPRGIWELLKIECLLWSSYSSIKLEKQHDTGGELLTSHLELQNIYPQTNDIVRRKCQRIHLVIDVGHFVVAAFHLARICADQH